MSKSVQIASVFTAIGFKVNKKDLDKLQKQLVNLKKQLTKLQSVAKLNINPNTQGLQSARKELIGINRELAKIKNKAIRVNVNGGSGVTGGGVTGRRGSTARGVAGGAFAGSALGELGQFGAGVGVLGGAAFAGASIFQTTAKLDAIKNALGAAAGGAEAGAKQFQFLEDTSERIGINLIDNARSYQNFLAASNAVGFSTDNAQKSFTATASAARVLGLSAADTNGAMRAMTQILSKGTVQAEELRGQLGERVPGAVGMMAKAVAEMQGKTEVTVQELGKMLEQGEIISKDVMPFFSKQLLKMATAHGALEHAQKTPLANLERMRNSFVKFQDAIGRSNFVFELSLLFQQLSSTMKESTKEGTVLGKAMGIIMNVFQAIFGIITAFPTPLKAFFVMWGALMIPLLIPLLAIAGVLLIIDDFISHMQGKGGFFTELLGADGFFKFVDDFRTNLLSVVADFWKEMVTFVPNLLMNAGLTGLNLMSDPMGTADALFKGWKEDREAASREDRMLPPKIETQQGPPTDTTFRYDKADGNTAHIIVSTTDPLVQATVKTDKGG